MYADIDEVMLDDISLEDMYKLYEENRIISIDKIFINNKILHIVRIYNP